MRIFLEAGTGVTADWWMFIAAEIAGWDLLEWIAFAASLLYTLLAARRHLWCWFFGLTGAAATLILCVQTRLYSESVLQVFYIVMAVYGWITWRRNAEGTQLERFVRMDLRAHLLFWGLGIAGTLLMGYFWSFFGAALPYMDAGIATFSMLCTWLMTRRYLENWLHWVWIDGLSVYLYGSRGLTLLALLFVLYTALSVYGYFSWRRQMKVAAVAASGQD